MAGIGRADQRHVDMGEFLDAAHHALETQATIGGDGSGPAALRLFRDEIEPAGDVFRLGGVGLAVVAEFEVQRTGNGRLLDDRAIVARMQAIKQRAQAQRILDQFQDVLAGTHFARAQFPAPRRRGRR